MDQNTCQRCAAPLDLEAEIVEWLRDNEMPLPCFCDDCQTVRRAEAAAARHAAAEKERQDAARRFIPARYRDAEFARFPAKLQAIQSHGFEDGIGVVIHGPSGTGKTTAAYHLISRRIADGTFTSAESVTGSAIAGIVVDSFSDEAIERDGARQKMKRLRSAPCIFLDDLDKTRPTAATMEFLFDLFEARSSRKLPVVITTQATGDKLAQLLADHRESTIPAAIIRRIRSFCRPVSTHNIQPPDTP